MPDQPKHRKFQIGKDGSVNAQCDFCSMHPATRQYDAGAEVIMQAFIESGPEIGPTHVYSCVWSSCERCGEYLDNEDMEGLKQLVITLWETNPMFADMVLDPEGKRQMADMLTQLYGALGSRRMVRIR